MLSVKKYPKRRAIRLKKWAFPAKLWAYSFRRRVQIKKKWWTSTGAGLFPNIARVGMKYLIVPATSTTFERLFSIESNHTVPA